MKYPFQKKSFWIVFSALSLLVLIIHFIEFQNIHMAGSRHSDEIFISLIFSVIIIFVFDYLIHLIFSKPGAKKE